MTSTSETGHAKNVANFYDLISFANGYGTMYNPSKSSLTVAQLTAKHAQADAALQGVITQNAAFNMAVNKRMQAFEDLRPLSTRLINALASTDATKEHIADAKGLNRKMQGQRASKKEQPVNPSEPAPKTISARQLSYDQMIQHFDGMISVLEAEPSYTPNETDLQIKTLKAKLVSLKDSNEKVADAYTAVSNARLNRNKDLYNQESGLLNIAAEVKAYIKSVFGARSQEFAQVKGLSFTKGK